MKAYVVYGCASYLEDGIKQISLVADLVVASSENEAVGSGTSRWRKEFAGKLGLSVHVYAMEVDVVGVAGQLGKVEVLR